MSVGATDGHVLSIYWNEVGASNMYHSLGANARCCLWSSRGPLGPARQDWLESRLPDGGDLKLALAASSSLPAVQLTKQTQLFKPPRQFHTQTKQHSNKSPRLHSRCPAPPKEAQTQPKPSPQTPKTPANRCNRKSPAHNSRRTMSSKTSP